MPIASINGWLIVGCLTSSGEYFMYFQDRHEGGIEHRGNNFWLPLDKCGELKTINLSFCTMCLFYFQIDPVMLEKIFYKLTDDDNRCNANDDNRCQVMANAHMTFGVRSAKNGLVQVIVTMLVVTTIRL